MEERRDETGIIWYDPISRERQVVRCFVEEDKIIRVWEPDPMLPDSGDEIWRFLLKIDSWRFIIFDNFDEGWYSFYWITPGGLFKVDSNKELLFEGFEKILQTPDGTFGMKPLWLLETIKRMLFGDVYVSE